MTGRSSLLAKWLENGRTFLQVILMRSWLPGYSQRELDEAQERYSLRFPPDLIELFLERRPALGYSWNMEDNRIREMLSWPLGMLLSDVEQGFWWPDWGMKPHDFRERAEVVREALSVAPRLIPIIGHRFIPEAPQEAGNPVFSMYGFDTIYYGSNLAEFFSNEFQGKHEVGATRHIPFWSDLVERFDDASAFYGTQSDSSR